MKKLFLIAAVAVSGLVSAQTGFKAGVHLGLPIGDLKEAYSFNIGLDAAYLWNINDDFKAGVTTGYSYFSGKSYDIPSGFDLTTGQYTYSSVKVNGAYIPVAGTAQYSINDNWFLGADLGYALYVGDGSGDGGFLYQPKAGFQTETYEIYAAYKGISSNGLNLSTIGAGFNYKF